MFRALAFVMLAIHLLWLAWILLGWLVTRRRQLLRWLHIGSLAWGIVVSILPWTCPLTFAENYFERRAGLASYDKSFLEHYVELLVYPEVNQTLLMACAVAACILILGIHISRFLRRNSRGW